MIITLILKTFLIAGLSIILYQDYKDRAVWWFLFPFFAAIAGLLHFKESLSWMFLRSIIFNLAAVTAIFTFAFLYARYKMKVNFLQEAVGAGDILFFLGLTGAFPSGTFVVILVFSMIFSLVLHSFIPGKQHNQTVPLAGYASLFLICVFMSSWFGLYENLYFNG